MRCISSVMEPKSQILINFIGITTRLNHDPFLLIHVRCLKLPRRCQFQEFMNSREMNGAKTDHIAMLSGEFQRILHRSLWARVSTHPSPPSFRASRCAPPWRRCVAKKRRDDGEPLAATPRCLEDLGEKCENSQGFNAFLIT